MPPNIRFLVWRFMKKNSIKTFNYRASIVFPAFFMMNVPIREYISICQCMDMDTKMTGAHITQHSLVDIQKNEDYALARNPRHFRILGVAAPTMRFPSQGRFE
jgi:hypothetical protein